MIIITTMDELPKGCYECPLCHETYCMAMLHAIPIGYIEMWIDQHRNTSGSAGYYLRWMMEDYQNFGKGVLYEDDLEEQHADQ